MSEWTAHAARLAACLSALLVLSVVAGCGGGTGGDASDLEDQPWQLTSATGLTTPGGAVASAVFTSGNVYATAGCNTERASYTLDNDSLEIGGRAGTLFKCAPPVYEFEQDYLGALSEVADWELDGEELVLSDGNGQELLRFEAVTLVRTES